MRLVTLRVGLRAAWHRHRGPGFAEWLGRQHGVTRGKADMLLCSPLVEICCLCLPTDEVLMSTACTGPGRSGRHTGRPQACTSVQWSDSCTCQHLTRTHQDCFIQLDWYLLGMTLPP